MITFSLINPQIYYNGETPYLFEHNCLFFNDGIEIDRRTVSFPWETTDAEVHVIVSNIVKESYPEEESAVMADRWDWPLTGPS